MSGVVAERLYPPTIPSSLPAFYASGGIATIAIPFSMNRSVSDEQVDGMVLKIKTVQSNVFLKTIIIDKNDAQQAIKNREAKFTWSNVTTDQIFNSIAIGQFLKVQMAYINNGITGYFSTVGVIKYTSKPEVYIENAIAETAGCIPVFKQRYFGIYETTEDKSERPYSYCFSLYNNKRGLVETSGWLLHNSSENTILSESAQVEKTLDQYTFESNLELNVQYYIQYGVRTLNNLEIYSPLYPTIYTLTVESDLKINLIASNVFDEGYVKLNFEMKEGYSTDTSLDNPVSLQIEKSTRKITEFGNGIYEDEYLEWEPLHRHYFASYSDLVNFEFKDFTIEQGITYRYAYRMYNENMIFSNRMRAVKDVKADFEDMFLWDGEKQIRIRFNPKVTSFKKNIAEQKVETIGSRYPVFTRNGVINYKEFPISGLISYRVDNEELFLDKATDLELTIKDEPIRTTTSAGLTGYEEKYIPISGEYNPDEIYYLVSVDENDQPMLIDGKYEYTKSVPGDSSRGIIQEMWEDWAHKLFTMELEPVYEDVNDLPMQSNLGVDNFRAERIFKMRLLEWLTNGRIKLFKSPAEGNYLVRLMNVSLSPEDKLSRMLHTFTSTAYECEELNYNNLVSLGFISLDEEVQNLWTTTTLYYENSVVSIYEYLNRNNYFNVSNNSSIKLNAYDIIKYIKVDNSTGTSGSSFYLRFGEDKVENRVLISTELELDAGSYSLMPDVWFNKSDNESLRGSRGWSDLLQSATLVYGYYNTDILYGELYGIEDIQVRNTISTFVGNGENGTVISFGTLQNNGYWQPGENILRFFVLDFEYKPAENHLYAKNNKFYIDSNCTVEQTSFNPTEMYQVRFKRTTGTEPIYLYVPTITGEMTTNSEYRAQTAIASNEVVYPNQIAVNNNDDNTWYSSEDIKKLFAGQTLVKLTTPDGNVTSFTQLPNINITDTTEYSLITLHESINLKAAYQNLVVTFKTS